jgi:hypothetical protein
VKEGQAATKIQAQYRGFSTRKKTASQREEAKKAAKEKNDKATQEKVIQKEEAPKKEEVRVYRTNWSRS